MGTQVWPIEKQPKAMIWNSIWFAMYMPKLYLAGRERVATPEAKTVTLSKIVL